jgi:phosphatidylcholine synthase
MKTPDYYFRGFPAVWNVAVFYLFVLRLPAWVSALAVVALSVLTFLPVHFIHPIRIPHMRAVTLAALVLWAVFAVIAVADDLAPGPWIVVVLSLLAVYFVGVGFLCRHHR